MLPEQDALIEKLHRKYFKQLTRYAMSTLGNTTKAQEVVQDAFHAAVLHIDDLMTHENPGGWLMETVKNKIRESERSRRRYLRRFLSLDSDISAELVPSDEVIPDQREQGDTSAIEKIEQALKPEEYQLLKRLIFDKASHLEVSLELGITVWDSQKRLQRIREKLYKEFPERKKRKKK